MKKNNDVRYVVKLIKERNEINDFCKINITSYIE